MKKAIAFLIALFMVSGTMVLAAENDGEIAAKLILSAKEKLKISDEEYEFDKYNMYSSDGTDVYSLNWKKKDDKNFFIYVEIDDSGDIYSCRSTYDYDSGAQKFLKYSKEEAAAAASEFIKKIDSVKAQAVNEPVATKQGGYYDVRFDRIEDGIKVNGNSLYCRVSGKTLDVVTYYATWDRKITFAPSEPITRDEAKKAYMEKLGYELFYTVVNEDYTDKVSLVYRPKYDDGSYIDALTGEAAVFEDNYSIYRNEAGLKESEKAINAVGLSEKEKLLVNEIEGMISKQKGENIARSVEEFGIDDAFLLGSSQIFKLSDGSYSMQLSFNLEDPDNSRWGYKTVTLDATSGALLSFNGYSGSNEEKKDEISYKEGQKTTEDFLSKYFAKEFAETTAKSALKERNGYYEYLRTVDGIKVSNNGFNVQVDTKSGEITNVSRNWTKAQFPSKEGVSDINAVYEKALSEDNFEMIYIIVPVETKPVKTPRELRTELVYRQSGAVYDAASSDEVSGYSLKPVTDEEKPVYVDIEGHYAEPYIKKLLEAGIYLEGNELRPDDMITQKDFAALLYKVLYDASPMPMQELYKHIATIPVFNLDESKSDEPMTRLGGIKLLLNVMGYSEFVSIKDIFSCPFTDVSESDVGYATVAAGIGLVSRADNKFYPDNGLKRGDALIIIYNYMSR